MFKSGDAGDPMPWATAVLLAWMLVAAGALLVWLGRQAATGSLKRNWLVGIRTSQTLASDDVWKRSHRAAAGALTISGLGPLILGPFLLLRPSNALGAGLILFALAWLVAGVVMAGRRARHPEADTATEGDSP